MHFIMNVYLDDHQNTLKYLKNTEVNLNNILIMTDDFNIRDNDWNSSYPHHLSHTDTLLEIANIFGLDLFMPIKFSDNFQNLNSVLNLMFLRTRSEELNNHLIFPDLQSPSDHTPLSVFIIVKEEFI